MMHDDGLTKPKNATICKIFHRPVVPFINLGHLVMAVRKVKGKVSNQLWIGVKNS